MLSSVHCFVDVLIQAGFKSKLEEKHSCTILVEDGGFYFRIYGILRFFGACQSHHQYLAVMGLVVQQHATDID